MEFNRNQFFITGMLVLFLGIQSRLVDTYYLNEKASRFWAEKVQPAMSGDNGSRSFLPAIGPTPRRTIRPPAALGWALISIGSVLVLHSFAMKRPGM